MTRPFKAWHVVLGLLCLMYFITYVDRVNVGAAAGPMQEELKLTNTDLGWVFSVFGYPYLLFQVFGGWVGDKMGPRLTLVLCGLIWSAATVCTGLVDSFAMLIGMRILLGFGEGATFPTATRAMQYWTPTGMRGLAQGLTHSFARLGGAVTPPIVAWMIGLSSWRSAFVALGCCSAAWVVLFALYFRDEPSKHRGVSAEELATLPEPKPRQKVVVPWGPLIARMWPVTVTYFCYGWCLWLYLNWLPLFFKNTYKLDLKQSAIFAGGVFFAGVVGDTLGGVISDALLKRTGNVRFARLSVIVTAFIGALGSLTALFFTHDITLVAICLSSGFFFAEMVIGPIWSIPMDIAPKYSGTAAGLMNSGSALAAIVSPLLAGYVIDWTGNWYLPFLMSIALLAVGALMAFAMHPERRFEDEAA